MHDGRVLHIEDNEDWQDIVERSLEGTPHHVVETADNMPTALEALNRVQSGELGANVVVLGGRLIKGHPPLERTGMNDPRHIMEHIRDLGLSVRVIGFSALRMSDFGVEVDAELSKTDFKSGDLAATIDELPELHPSARELARQRRLYRLRLLRRSNEE